MLDASQDADIEQTAVGAISQKSKIAPRIPDLKGFHQPFYYPGDAAIDILYCRHHFEIYSNVIRNFLYHPRKENDSSSKAKSQ